MRPMQTLPVISILPLGAAPRQTPRLMTFAGQAGHDQIAPGQLQRNDCLPAPGGCQNRCDGAKVVESPHFGVIGDVVEAALDSWNNMQVQARQSVMSGIYPDSFSSKNSIVRDQESSASAGA